MGINPALLDLARHKVWQTAAPMEKSAVVPAGQPMDPAAMGGAPQGGAPAGGAPPADPSMMGGAPQMGGGMPMDPSMMGGAPQMGGAPPMPGAAPMDPNAAAMGGMGQPAPQKLKPEQMMQMLDFRLYNMQQQLTALMNAMNVQLPPGALVTPPGSPTPVAEAAVPGGPQDPATTDPNAGAGGGGAATGGGASAISPIDQIQGASPALAAGGGEKTGQAQDVSFSQLIDQLSAPLPPCASVVQEPSPMQKTSMAVGEPFNHIFERNTLQTNAQAIATLLRQRQAAGQA